MLSVRRNDMEILKNKLGFICDMDGVIYHGNKLLPGVPEFVDWLYKENKNFLFLTNSSERSPKELQQKLKRMGLDVDESHFYTSALATARFISSQSPGCSVYTIGGAGLIMALHDEGITMNEKCYNCKYCCNYYYTTSSIFSLPPPAYFVVYYSFLKLLLI